MGRCVIREGDLGSRQICYTGSKFNSFKVVEPVARGRSIWFLIHVCGLCNSGRQENCRSGKRSRPID